MTRRKKLTILGAAGATLIALVFAGWHQLRSLHNPEVLQQHVAHKLGRMLDRVDADDEQRAKILSLSDRVFGEMVTAHSGSSSAKQAMLSQWERERPDGTQLHELVDQRIAAYGKAAHELVDGMLEAHATLKPEQRAEIGEMLSRRLRR